MEIEGNRIELNTDVEAETTAMKMETIDAEQKSLEFRDSRRKTSCDAATKLTPYVSIPQPQEEQIESPIQIKHEPELILEPEELPASAMIDAEAITNNDEPSVAKRNKLDPNKCYICNKVFETVEGVRLHLSKHGDMIPYHCNACAIETGRELKITSLHRLHCHFWLHATAIKCPKCSEWMRTDLGMQKHIETKHQQSNQVEYICEQCGKNFQNEQSLYEHVFRHKVSDEGRYACYYCDRKFRCTADLIQHKLIHADEMPYQCSTCDKDFRTKIGLRKHISIFHSISNQVNDDPIRTFKCEGCDFSTTNKYKYWRHKAEHELKFQCSQCSQRFPTGRQLQLHRQVHSGVELFQCEQCDKNFQSKKSLEEHVTSHNNERPYGCEICGLCFNRKQHLLKHSAQLSFECRPCGIKYRNCTSYAQHEKTHMEIAVKLIDPDTDVAEVTSAMKTETIDAERMFRVCRDSQSETTYDAAPKLTPCVSIPQPQEEQIQHPIQIKQEPELILEPEELPDCAITDAETVTDSAESSTGEFGKMRDIVLDLKKCCICNKVFESTEDVRMHLSEHGDMIPYQCSICTIETGQELWITSLQKLHSHFRKHANAIKCPECPHRTWTRWAMMTHLRKYHEQSDQVEYICEQCGKKCVNKNALRKHVMRHKAIDEGRFPCSYCDRKLSCKTALVRHEQVHTSERPYQCYECAKSFRTSHYLSKHIF